MFPPHPISGWSLDRFLEDFCPPGSRWSLLAVWGALVLAVTLADAPQVQRIPWPDNEPRVLTSVSGEAEFDVPLGADEELMLVVSRLAEDLSPSTIQVSAESIPDQVARPDSLARWVPLPAVTDVLAAPEERKDGTDTREEHPTSNTAPATRSFWIHVGESELEDRSGYAKITTDRILGGKRVEIWRDRSLPDGLLTAEHSAEVVELLEREVLPFIDERLGRITDVDGDGRLAVCVTPWLGRLQGGRTTVRGYVRNSDFNRDLAAPYSNQAEILYLNSDLPTGSALKTLLLHETAHAAIFSRRQAIAQGKPGVLVSPLPDWWNEGLAHLAEQAGRGDWSNLDSRISRAQANPAGSPVLVTDYYRTGLWRDPGSRGAAYLFLDWCQRRFGHEWLERSLTQPRFEPQLAGDLNGLPLAELFRDWTIDRLQQPFTPVQNRHLGPYLVGTPRVETWDLAAKGADRGLEFSLVGTGTAYWKLRAGDASRVGWQRIRVRDQAKSPLQISVWRKPKATETVALNGTWRDPGENGSQSAEGLTAKLDLPTGWTCEELHLESLSGTEPRVYRFPHTRLREELDHPAAQHHQLPWDLVLSGESATSQWVLKALVRDSRNQTQLVYGVLPARPADAQLAAQDGSTRRSRTTQR